LGLKQKFRNTLQLAAGIEILAFRSSATSSRHIKSFHDFIAVWKTLLTSPALHPLGFAGPAFFR
jgi:hypothetical protein